MTTTLNNNKSILQKVNSNIEKIYIYICIERSIIVFVPIIHGA